MFVIMFEFGWQSGYHTTFSNVLRSWSCMWKSFRTTFSTNCNSVYIEFAFTDWLNSLFSEIYLDGNQFGCQGAYDLIKLLLIDCEKMLSDKRDKLRMENELKAQEGLS